MRVSVIFHSVTGNCYCVAKIIADACEKLGHEVSMFRVEDAKLETYVGMFDRAKDYIEEIRRIPYATTESITSADFVFLGSPTYYGNISACTKAYMDSFVTVFSRMPDMSKVSFVPFTTVSSSLGGAQFTLQAMVRFAQHLGMMVRSIPFFVGGAMSMMPAYGFLHECGADQSVRPAEKIQDVVARTANLLLGATPSEK
eukprot:gnl/Chilomastix_cuspidata/254.p2 GENE.gnl/Chilomastix_cuspidata/254~~gnl/Chilomastix_cuspidata/254.p2  ORF type:complete len:199 (-),score=60.75 gnl/Chilomastix_cuspidata/254:18-614(-)